MTATSASVRFGAEGPAAVESFIRLTGNTIIHCCLYDDIAPILAIDDGYVKVSLTVPVSQEVTGDDVASARRLAAAVAEYVAELERRTHPAREAGAGDLPGQAAGWVP